MSQKRKLHPLTGSIKYAWLATCKSRLYKNQPFYCLEIELQSLFSGKLKPTIYVFPNLVNKEVWNTLTQSTYKNKSYTFWCEKRVRGWRLKKWEEIEYEKN